MTETLDYKIGDVFLSLDDDCSLEGRIDEGWTWIICGTDEGEYVGELTDKEGNIMEEHWYSYDRNINEEIECGNLELIDGPSLGPKFCVYCNGQFERTDMGNKIIYSCQDCFRIRKESQR